VRLLEWSARKLGTTYNAINVWFFCVIWPAITIGLIIAVIVLWRKVAVLQHPWFSKHDLHIIEDAAMLVGRRSADMVWCIRDVGWRGKNWQKIHRCTLLPPPSRTRRPVLQARKARVACALGDLSNDSSENTRDTQKHAWRG